MIIFTSKPIFDLLDNVSFLNTPLLKILIKINNDSMKMMNIPKINNITEDTAPFALNGLFFSILKI